MAQLKITFYKGYPITPESEYAPYFDTPHDTAASVYSALNDYKKIEYNITGDFTPLQNYINVQSFAEVDGCNYVRVEVVGEYTKYYYIKDIVALSQIERDGRYYRPAQVFLYEDIYLSNFYQATSTGALKKPLISGNLVQCSRYEYLQDYNQTPPMPLRFEGSELINARNQYYNRFAILVTYTDNDGNIGHIVDDNLDFSDFSTRVNILSGLSAIKNTNQIGSELKEFTHNVNLLNMYILPNDWISPFLYDFSGIVKSITAIGANNTELDVTFLTGFRYETLGEGVPVKVATLTPEKPVNSDGYFEDLNRYFLKTANNFISIPWKGGKMTESNKPKVDIYIEISNSGTASDTINIFAMIGETLIDISNDFKIDTAVNQAALNISQHKVSTALNVMTGVVGGVGGVVGGIASGNYFGAVAAAAGGVNSITGVFEGLESPAKMNVQGNAAAALGLYGLITILKLYPQNNEVVKAEIYRHGYLYPEKPFISASYLINNGAYIKLENAIVNGDFGVDISRELQERLAKGVKFMRLEDI